LHGYGKDTKQKGLFEEGSHKVNEEEITAYEYETDFIA